jgi:type IV pilus assembly protein PilQ
MLGSSSQVWAEGDEAAGVPLEPVDEQLLQPATLGGGDAAVADAAAPASADGLISIDFKDADIRQVLRIISLKSAVDIVAGQDIEGLVTIKLSNVPWEQALEIILRTYGFTYERKGKIIRVMTVEALANEALSTDVFPLDYATAKEVPDIINEMLSDRGRVKFDERTNTVIVTDIPTNLFQIKQVIQRLDQRTPQVSIETKVVETKLDKNENLGIDWSDSLTWTLASATVPTTFPFPGGKELGAVGSAFIPRPGTLSPSTGASLTRGRIPETGGTFTFGTLTTSGLASVFNFLQSRTDTNIVSNPNIAVLNNQQAKIHIGEEYPVPSYTIDPTTGRTSISGYTPKLTGTVLTVTPHVNPSNEIVVELKPEVISVGTDVTYSLGSSSGSVSFPRFTTQTAQTQVRIRSGDTIAIAGLVKRSEAKVSTKVPLLSDIPGVGLLFKNSRWYSGGSDPVRQDLIIFLTVRMMEEAPRDQNLAAVPGE